MYKDKELFSLLDKATLKKWKRFKKFYLKDSKPFHNKLLRDYEGSGKFPVHILKLIKNINKEDYDSGVCVLRGGLAYAVLFELCGWRIHFIACGRRNAKITFNKKDLRFNKSVDRSLENIKGKKVLLIENNVFSGITPEKVVEELKKCYKIKKPDLFVDYFVKGKISVDKKILKVFGKVFVASKFFGNPGTKKKFSKTNVKVSKNERIKLLDEFIEKLR